MSKHGYYQDTLELIIKINNKSKSIPLKECILLYKKDFKQIAYKIRCINYYTDKILSVIDRYEKKMIKKYQEEKMQKPLFVIYYLDLLQKLKEAVIPLQQIMSVCVNIVLIDSAIYKDIEGREEG